MNEASALHERHNTIIRKHCGPQTKQLARWRWACAHSFLGNLVNFQRLSIWKMVLYLFVKNLLASAKIKR